MGHSVIGRPLRLNTMTGLGGMAICSGPERHSLAFYSRVTGVDGTGT
jgi:hypothetical protein